ncbi:hypothetical protein PRV_00550 [Mycoplasma parvum str. Indiana]|uniref:Uncharacterized protein n=1 Tax=Mycoplasma parvum str. Indiana TaxID=1403316 RepID=U5NFG2_9MOLU|nr:hypothetical protein PRV_00550 [Mycoplasma parvum str. Indiana]
MFTSGTTSLLSYLIPYSLSSSENQLANFFKAGESIYDNQEINQFKTNETERLNNTKSLHTDWKKYKESAEELKELKFKTIQELFQSILNSEEQLNKLYEKNIEVINQLIKSFEELAEQSKENISVTAWLEQFKHKANLLKQINERVKELGNILKQFICIIDISNKETQQNEACEQQNEEWTLENLSKNNQNSHSAGGVLIHNNYPINLL